MLEQTDGLMMNFDEGLWNASIETVTVWLDGSIDSQRKNGAKLRQELRKVEFRITKNDNPLFFINIGYRDHRICFYASANC